MATLLSIPSEACTFSATRIGFKSSFTNPLHMKIAMPKCSVQISLTKPTKIRCQQLTVPREERWLFEDDEINGPDIWNTTWYPKAADHENVKKTWYVVDATDKILGRLASTIAIHIRGKNLATYTPSVDMGAYVIVLGRALFTHLKVYKGPDHPHGAQQPIDLPIKDKRIQIQR